MIIRSAQEGFLALLLDQTNYKNVILVQGARQVGKSTFVESALKALPLERWVITVNLEEDRVLREQIDHTQNFNEFQSLLESRFSFNPAGEQVLFLDEAQESERLGTYVRFMKEKWERATCVLTGSSMTRLFTKETRFPVGRVTRFVIHPFSFEEFLCAGRKTALLETLHSFRGHEPLPDFLHQDLLAGFDSYLAVGGLPRVVSAFWEQADYRTVRRGILLDQEEDFVRKVYLEKRHLFMDSLRGVASHLGTPSKLVHIAERSETAREILALMEAWHLILRVDQHASNISTEMHPKRYLYDLGIAQAVRQMPFPQISILHTLNEVLRTDLGGLFENAVRLELDSNLTGEAEFSSWRKSNRERQEVDFVWKDGNRVIPVECKAALKVTSRSFSNLKKFMDLSGADCGIVVSAAPFSVFHENGKRIINVPIYLCSREILRRVAALGTTESTKRYS